MDWEVSYYVSERRSALMPLPNREGRILTVPFNIRREEGGAYVFSEYRVNMDSKQPLDRTVVNAMADAMCSLLHRAVQTLKLSGKDVVYMAPYYPAWDKDREWNVRDKCVYNGKVWVRKQPWAGTEINPPSTHTMSLWEAVDEKHDGTESDPIEYRAGMELKQGKYYSENGVVYFCKTGSGQAVSHPLSQLVNLFVEVVPKKEG